ncbi:UNVERIFIED_ORG: hypothetical protein ABIB19_000161 [Arthrobacter sp. UYEF10]
MRVSTADGSQTTDQEDAVLHAAVLDVGEPAHPELRALAAGAGPESRITFSPPRVTPTAA